MSGNTKINVGGHKYLIGSPTSLDYYLAQEIYVETYYDACAEGIFNSEDIVGFLILNKLWDSDKEQQLVKLHDDIDNLKIRIYNSEFRPNETMLLKQILRKTKEALGGLLAKKHQYDYVTAEGLAGLARNHYLLGMTICDIRGKPLWNDAEFWDNGDDGIISQIMFSMNEHRIDDTILRDISHTEPWRTYWLASDKCPFKGSPADYSDEQRSIIMWSRLYDSILDHPEKPSETVIHDNDMLDGWMLQQQGERKEKQKQKDAEKKLTSNAKINNSQQVFLMTKEVYDQYGKNAPEHMQSLREVGELTNSLNTPQAKMIQQERFAVIKAAGEIRGDHLPDVQRDLQMQLNQKMMKRDK